MEKTARPFLTHWLPVGIWMALIFFLSGRQSISVSEEYILNFLFFKLLHVLEYAMLFMLFTRATRSYKSAFIFTIVYAMTDELHQQFVPSREGRLRDVIIDAIGAGSTWYYLSEKLHKAPKKLKDWARKLDVPMFQT